MRHSISLRPFGLSLFIVMCWTSSTALAQTDNYWSWNFNTPSVLLAGSVVGGNAGASSVFYNPSLIDNDSIPSLSVTANVISLQFLSAENIAGEGLDADKFIFKVQPRFVSYVFPTKNERIGVEAAFLSPVSEEVNFTAQYEDELELINRTQGLEVYEGYLKYSRRYDDYYVGAGLSYTVSEKISVGLSSFVSVKTMRYTYQQDAQAYQNTDSVLVGNSIEARYIAESNLKEELKYWDLSLVFKLGAQYKTLENRLNFGLNLTFPNIPIYGEGDIRKSSVRSNVFDNQADQFTSNDRNLGFEEKVRTTVKTPFSAAFGIQYFSKSRRNFVSLTAEYFNEIEPYKIVSLSDPETSQDMINISSPFYSAEARSVTNFGIGFKQIISPKWFVLGGFRTDFTVAPQGQSQVVFSSDRLNRINLDKYHFSAGPVFTIKRFRVITGIQYSYGRNRDMEQLVSFSDPIEYVPALNQSLQGFKDGSAGASLNEISLFLGVTVDL